MTKPYRQGHQGCNRSRGPLAVVDRMFGSLDPSTCRTRSCRMARGATNPQGPDSATQTRFKPLRAKFFLAATKQLYDWFSPPVCLSACPSIRPSHFFDYVPIIVSSWNFHELLPMTKVMSMQEVKVKVTEVMTPFSRFRTVTPVWIHKLRWNDAYSFMLLRRGALMFFKVIRQISRSHGSKNRRIWPKLGVSGL